MHSDSVASHIEETGIVGIVRGASADVVIEVVDALRRGGVDVVEITADTDGVADLLADVAASFGDEVTLGAGTVLDAPTARAVLMNGASFVVTPTVNPAVIETANRYGAPSLPGAYTPTEAIEAYEAGADAVKVFPTSTGGPDHVRAIRGPLPQVPLVPTGGVSTADAAAYFEAGATALGVGSSLVDLEAAERGDYGTITANAETFRRIADERSGSRG